MRNWTTILLLGTQLYELIQKAQKDLGRGTGPAKKQQVLRDFGTFVEMVATSGALNEKASARVLRLVPSAIKFLVEAVNVFEAWDAEQEAEKPPAEPPATPI